MRKYKMPKILYAMLAIVLLVLAVDYTYAYFSANTTASGTLGMADISVKWMQSYYPSTDSEFPEYADLPESSVGIIDISENELKRSAYTNIKYAGNDITLMLSASIETPIYCRLKLDASYIKTTTNGEQVTNETVDCSAYIKLALNNILLENSTNWKFENGYYYYKTGSTLNKISTNTIFDIANQLYLDSSSSSEIYGKELTIKLKADIVQADYVTVGTDVWTN